MTPTPTTDSAVSPVSDERLKQIVAYVELMGPNSEPCVPGDVAQSMAAELLSRRSLDTAGMVTEQQAHAAIRYAEQNGIKIAPEEIRELLSLASRTPNTEMVVKALEWEKGFGRWDAQSVLGRYSILPNKGLPKPFEVLAPHGYLQMADDIDAAMAVAQADFDQRIRSALASPPSPAEGTDTLALEALRGLILLKDLFDASDRNQADAYYILAKQDGAWGNARSALASLQLNKKG